MATKTISERRAQLEARRDLLAARAGRIDRKLQEPASRDWNEAAQEGEDDEVLERLGLASDAEKARIDAALTRIAAGCYGICVTCGRDISQQRLDLLPATPYCRTCAPR